MAPIDWREMRRCAGRVGAGGSAAAIRAAAVHQAALVGVVLAASPKRWWRRRDRDPGQQAPDGLEGRESQRSNCTRRLEYRRRSSAPCRRRRPSAWRCTDRRQLEGALGADRRGAAEPATALSNVPAGGPPAWLGLASTWYCPCRRRPAWRRPRRRSGRRPTRRHAPTLPQARRQARLPSARSPDRWLTTVAAIRRSASVVPPRGTANGVRAGQRQERACRRRRRRRRLAPGTAISGRPISTMSFQIGRPGAGARQRSPRRGRSAGRSGRWSPAACRGYRGPSGGSIAPPARVPRRGVHRREAVSPHLNPAARRCEHLSRRGRCSWAPSWWRTGPGRATRARSSSSWRPIGDRAGDLRQAAGRSAPGLHQRRLTAGDLPPCIMPATATDTAGGPQACDQAERGWLARSPVVG